MNKNGSLFFEENKLLIKNKNKEYIFQILKLGSILMLLLLFFFFLKENYKIFLLQ